MLNESPKEAIRTSDLQVICNPYVILGLAVIGFLVLIAVMKMPQNKDQETKVNIGEGL